jgi:hypothetical protein
MMSTFIDTLNDLPPKAKRRLLLGWLPILLVTILLCVIGGLPPTSWGLTIRLLALLNALKAVHASPVSDSLNALLVQSVCIFIAWLMVILAIASEVVSFKAMQTQLRISRLQAKLVLPAHNVLTAAASAPPVLVVPPAINVASPFMNVATAPLPKHHGVRVTIDDSLDTYPTNPFMGIMADAKSPNSQGVQISFKQQGQSDPFALQQENTVEEPVFVYGNPFEGDLPEVFTYDKDLQQAVEGLRNVSGSKQSPADNKGAETGNIN